MFDCLLCRAGITSKLDYLKDMGMTAVRSKFAVLASVSDKNWLYHQAVCLSRVAAAAA
jgi:hypothetical protein